MNVLDEISERLAWIKKLRNGVFAQQWGNKNLQDIGLIILYVKL